NMDMLHALDDLFRTFLKLNILPKILLFISTHKKETPNKNIYFLSVDQTISNPRSPTTTFKISRGFPFISCQLVCQFLIFGPRFLRSVYLYSSRHFVTRK